MGLIEFDYISPKTLEIFGTVPDWVKYRDILLDLRPVNLARIHTYDLILMDVRISKLNGYQATAQLRQDLALTANAIGGERIKCLAAGRRLPHQALWGSAAAENGV